MDYTFNVNWRGNLVGEITNLTQDMWYMSGNWKRFETAQTEEFEHLILNFDRELFEKDPVANSIKVILFTTNYPDRKIYCLATCLENNEISLRQVVADAALNKFFPDR